MAQFTIRTMEGDLKNASLQPTPAASVKAATPVPPTSYLKTVAPTPTAPIAPRQDQIKPVQKTAPFVASPTASLPKAPEAVKNIVPPLVKKESAAITEEQNKKAAILAQKEKDKAAALVAKEAARAVKEKEKAAALAAKEKLKQEEEAQEKELRDLFELAKSKIITKDFKAASLAAQKVADNPQAGWLIKWQAKRIINKAQKEAAKEIPLPAPAPIKNIVPIPPKATIAPAAPAVSPVSPKIEPVKPPFTPSIPANLPVVDETPIAKKEEALNDLLFSKEPSLEKIQTPPAPAAILPKVFQPSAPAPVTPAPKPFKMATNIIPGLNELPTNEPAEVLDVKKIVLVVFASVVVMTLIIGGLYFFLRESQTVVQVSQSPSPTPSQATQTPSPAPSPLFVADSQKIFELKTGQEKANFQEALAQIAQTEEPAQSLAYISFKNSEGAYLSLTDIATLAEIDFFDLPTQVATGPLRTQLETDSFSFFNFSQPSASSSPFTMQANSGRLGLVISINNSTTTSLEDLTKSLKDLEQLMIPSLKILLPDDIKNSLPANPVWLNNTYRNIAIRYVNLPEASLSFDYAILNNKLIFATSKDSMLAMIDRLLSEITTINNDQP